MALVARAQCGCHQLPQHGAPRRWGLGGTPGSETTCPVPFVPVSLQRCWDLLFLCYPFAAALEVINTSLESRGFSKRLPSATTYRINHSPRNKLVLTWGFPSNWISPFQKLLLICLKFCKVPYVHVIAWTEKQQIKIVQQPQIWKPNLGSSDFAPRLGKHHVYIFDNITI